VTAPAEGRYRVHLVDGPQDFGDPEQAMSLLETVLRGEAEQAARAAGAEDIRILVNRDIRQVPVEGREVFIEAEVTVEASGRPRIAAE